MIYKCSLYEKEFIPYLLSIFTFLRFLIEKRKDINWVKRVVESFQDLLIINFFSKFFVSSKFSGSLRK